MDRTKTLYDVLKLQVGNLTVKAITPARWGTEVEIDCVYRYPPEEKAITLRFSGVRSMQWITVRTDAAGLDEAQVLTHDLGEGDYQRTARFATTIAEIIISYRALDVAG